MEKRKRANKNCVEENGWVGKCCEPRISTCLHNTRSPPTSLANTPPQLLQLELKKLICLFSHFYSQFKLPHVEAILVPIDFMVKWNRQKETYWKNSLLKIVIEIVRCKIYLSLRSYEHKKFDKVENSPWAKREAENTRVENPQILVQTAKGKRSFPSNKFSVRFDVVGATIW